MGSAAVAALAHTRIETGSATRGGLGRRLTGIHGSATEKMWMPGSRNSETPQDSGTEIARTSIQTGSADRFGIHSLQACGTGTGSRQTSAGGTWNFGSRGWAAGGVAALGAGKAGTGSRVDAGVQRSRTLGSGEEARPGSNGTTWNFGNDG